MSELREISKEEVAKHKFANDCWVIINNRVWDVTSFIRDHPAGPKIILLHAGKDCTSAYNDVHSEDYLLRFLPGKCMGVIAGSNQKAIKPLDKRQVLKVPFNENTILSSPRTLYTSEHEEFRKKFRTYIDKNILPHYAGWEQRGESDPNASRGMFDNGYYLKLNIPTKYGGMGIKDWRYNAILAEEMEYADMGNFSVTLGNDIVLPYFLKQATPEQQEYWIPKIVAQRSILAVAMSEPELGSDLGKLATRAVKSADGSKFVLNGRKMWISAGSAADLVVVSAVTDPSAGYRGISLLVVERGMKGFETAKRFQKLGKLSADTCLLTFENVEVPAKNLIGEEGFGFLYMMSNLAKERMSIAVTSMANCRRALALTTNYVHGRTAFGGTLAGLQSIQQKLSKLRVDIQVTTTFIDQCIIETSQDKLSAETASMAKIISTELASRVADECLQCYGGYGYLKHNPVGKIWADQRVARIFGGANEVLLEVVGKGLKFQPQRMKSKL